MFERRSAVKNYMRNNSLALYALKAFIVFVRIKDLDKKGIDLRGPLIIHIFTNLLRNFLSRSFTSRLLSSLSVRG